MTTPLFKLITQTYGVTIDFFLVPTSHIQIIRKLSLLPSKYIHNLAGSHYLPPYHPDPVSSPYFAQIFARVP
jgi:hypothetical protein